MLRNTLLTLKTAGLKSHQITGAGYPFNKHRFGFYYGRNMQMYGNGGFGISTYSARKKHNPKVRPLQHGSEGGTTLLSGHWRSYALADGGVLFTHPSHKQLMAWSAGVAEKEAAESGITAVSEANKAKIQSIIVDNTLENHGLATWRRKHLWRLVEAKSSSLTANPNRRTYVDTMYKTVRSIDKFTPIRRASVRGQ